MKFSLERYQQVAVDALVNAVHRARRGYFDDPTDPEMTAIGLTAPTGAGKTVIATALLENLYFGTMQREAIPELTVLWVTDDRSLNAQTISKILQASGGRIDANRVRFLGDTDARTLEAGHMYFVHIQALQKNSTLHAVRADGSRSDNRTHGAWDMIGNTVRQRGGDLLVIWDEAHRGSGTSAKDRNTLARTIVDGGLSNVGTQQPAAPMVLGISATPDRFRAAMTATGRTMRLVDVPPGDVRESGLLKDRILLRNIAEDQSADNTMLALAVADLRASDEAWRTHHHLTGDRPVEPLLVVQVEPKVSDGRLGEILSTIETAWPELTDYAVAHAFGEPHGPLTVGDKTVRYLAPEAIAGDDRARVVLFKSALTTGWDCPRAEVLVSFQNKDSYTEIAQLIGRLVRTPLAQRVESGDDRLNEVVAYLPGFRTEHVARVVRALTEDETVRVEVLISPEICVRSQEVPNEVFDLLDTLPSYTRVKASYPSRTAQLMRLAAALNEHDLVKHGSLKARQWVVDQMRAADSQRREEIDAKVADLLSLDVATTTLGLQQEVVTSSVIDSADTVERDLDAYFSRAQRLLPDGSASWYFNDLCDRGFDDLDAGVRLTAMAALGFKSVIEESAVRQIAAWRDAHASAVGRKPRSVRELIEAMWHLGARDTHPTTVEARQTYPASAEKIVGDAVVSIGLYPKHIHAIESGPNTGLFPVDTSRSSWEERVLESELQAPGLVGWYRNPSSGRHALALPYEFGGKSLLMHPDFFFWHQDGPELVMDIVDPHRHDLADTAPKWEALAKYAADHPDRVRRVLAVIESSVGELRALDLTADGAAERIGSTKGPREIEALFQAEGMAY